MVTRQRPALADLVRHGFADLDGAAASLDELADLTGIEPSALLALFRQQVADPDDAARQLLRIAHRSRERLSAILADHAAAFRLTTIVGASSGLADFLVRHPGELSVLASAPFPLDAASATEVLLHAVQSEHGIAALSGTAGRRALRVEYRRRLLALAAWDLTQQSGTAGLEIVAAALADLAAAALEAALAVARAEVGERMPDARDLDAVRLSIIGMGKAGARELNYVSDVDVIFVAGGTAPDPVAVATRLAACTMRVLDETDVEPPLWQVDANLRPEGKDGALVRTLESHVAYYHRWAKGWEFQALLKARPLAGDAELGAAYIDAIQPMVWQVSGQPDFVSSVQRMRERVEANIPPAQADRQLKLGTGGLRDIEFTVQLLQLVHGRTDPTVHERATLPALRALAEAGYVGRVEAAEFGEDYRILRLLEHRLQLRRLRRTHLMPTAEDELRVLARGSRLANDAASIEERWNRVRSRVRGLHQRLFYRPLLSAVARYTEDPAAITSAAAADRLAGVGYRDPRGALQHIAALTGGVSRRAAIQSTLLPVLLQWFAEGPDPDLGLLAFRRLSEQLGDANWYLRMLRDAPEAARRLSTVLSTSRFVTNLLDLYPEVTAWLERDADLHPRSWDAIRAETSATVLRHATRDAAGAALRTARRREILRLALAGLLGMVRIEELGQALSSVTSSILVGVLRSIRRDDGPWPEFAIIAMGRFGGAETGFGSDADIMYVYRPIAGMAPEVAQRQAEYIVSEINRLTQDHRLPLDLDLDLRPEGKNGARVRSLRSYEAYYERWSLTWESQALLRARGIAGDSGLVADFEALADRYRYPVSVDAAAVREIRRIKSRIETERLPRGADPTRHLKLGRGTLSDVEWLVQLVQLRHAARIKGLRTQNTLQALDAAVASRLIGKRDAAVLREAWLFASRARSAMTLWTSRTSDLLPTDRDQLEGVARILEYPPGSASAFEEDFLRITRRSRAVYERLFFED